VASAGRAQSGGGAGPKAAWALAGLARAVGGATPDAVSVGRAQGGASVRAGRTSLSERQGVVIFGGVGRVRSIQRQDRVKGNMGACRASPSHRRGGAKGCVGTGGLSRRRRRQRELDVGLGQGQRRRVRWQRELEPLMGWLRRLCMQEGPESEEASAGQARSRGGAGRKASGNVSDQIQQCLENLGR